jgi:hypothetical protein
MAKAMAFLFENELIYGSKRLLTNAYNLALRVKIGSSIGVNDEKETSDIFTFYGFQFNLKRLH